MKKTLSVETPHGTFTRKTDNRYTHVVVRICQGATDAFARAQAGERTSSAVAARWIKDRGHVTTWHKSEASARTAAAKPYNYARNSTVLGVYPVKEG